MLIRPCSRAAKIIFTLKLKLNPVGWEIIIINKGAKQIADNRKNGVDER